MSDIIPQNNVQCAFHFESDTIPSTPGIYAIVNRINQHVYVGSAKNLLYRKQHHFRDLKAGKHKNPHLQRAYDSYGPDALLFGVIEYVEHAEQLLAREQYYIDTLDPIYNIARTAGSNLGLTYSLETRARMSEARRANGNMPEQMAKLNADRRGKHLTPEHRAKVSAVQVGKTLSSEHKAKISTALLGKKKTPEHSANIRAAKLGVARPPEVIAKMHAAKRSSQRGRKLTPEHRAKISAAKRGGKLTPEHRAKIGAVQRARRLSRQDVTQPPLL